MELKLWSRGVQRCDGGTTAKKNCFIAFGFKESDSLNIVLIKWSGATLPNNLGKQEGKGFDSRVSKYAKLHLRRQAPPTERMRLQIQEAEMSSSKKGG